SDKHFLARASLSLKTHILPHILILTLQRIFTPPQYHVSKTNQALLNIKPTRSQLLNSPQHHFTPIIKHFTPLNLKTFHTHLSTITRQPLI
ncbi:Na-translocating system protein MpsC family protein, partial [Staphylococcus epidermidis]|uniref:Na-translocating system protein MpsC family protein n=1 Tax=Staphylococcus epidermidis TaxID=1282 RepID=UPI0011A3485A